MNECKRFARKTGPHRPGISATDPLPMSPPENHGLMWPGTSIIFLNTNSYLKLIKIPLNHTEAKTGEQKRSNTGRGPPVLCVVMSLQASHPFYPDLSFSSFKPKYLK